MKLSFTTLGVADWELGRIISSAKDLGFQGVDIRCYKGSMEPWTTPEFSSQIGATRRAFGDEGLIVSGYSSSVRVFPGEKDGTYEDQKDLLRRSLDVCAELGGKVLRVFGGFVDTSDTSVVSIGAEALAVYGKIGEEYGVKIALETHDSWRTGVLVRRLIESAGSPGNVGSLWDVNHPALLEKEPVAQTAAALASTVCYTHWKDSKVDPENPSKVDLCVPGEGSLPAEEIFAALQNIGYDGWYTLEWERFWHPELPAGEVVLPLYVDWMKKLEANYKVS